MTFSRTSYLKEDAENFAGFRIFLSPQPSQMRRVSHHYRLLILGVAPSEYRPKAPHARSLFITSSAKKFPKITLPHFLLELLLANQA